MVSTPVVGPDAIKAGVDAPAVAAVGLLRVGLVSVLFVSVSAPAKVANVPVVGSVTFVVAVVVSVSAKLPEVVKLLANDRLPERETVRAVPAPSRTPNPPDMP